MPCTIEPWEEAWERRQARKEAGLEAKEPDLPWEVIDGKRVVAAFKKRKPAKDYAKRMKLRAAKCPC